MAFKPFIGSKVLAGVDITTAYTSDPTSTDARKKAKIDQSRLHQWSSYGLDTYSDMMPDPLLPIPQSKSAARQEEQDEPVDLVPSKDSTPTFVHKNDYAHHFFDTNKRPQNYIRDSKYDLGFDEYPDLKKIIQMKDKLVRYRATPPMYLQVDLKTVDLPAALQSQFDVILIDPPWFEYHERAPTIVKEYWTAKEIATLQIPEIAAEQCFLFLWCGAADAVEAGRVLLRNWGFRRCEDIVWIKTNRIHQQDDPQKITPNPLTYKGWYGNSIMSHTKEHCLVGMKGTIKRNVDAHFIHANIDTDVIVTEEPPYGSPRKPNELYAIIEHFCNGRRRIELFGETHNLRQGWVTVGREFDIASNYDSKKYLSYFESKCEFHDWLSPAQVMDLYQTHPSGNTPNMTCDSQYLLGSTKEMERDRPQSPSSMPKPLTIKQQLLRKQR